MKPTFSKREIIVNRWVEEREDFKKSHLIERTMGLDAFHVAERVYPVVSTMMKIQSRGGYFKKEEMTYR